MELTKAQKKCLGNIVALGGTFASDAPKIGVVNKAVVMGLAKAGLVELGKPKTRKDVFGTKCKWPHDTLDTWYATPVGTQALGSKPVRFN